MCSIAPSGDERPSCSGERERAVMWTPSGSGSREAERRASCCCWARVWSWARITERGGSALMASRDGNRSGGGCAPCASRACWRQTCASCCAKCARASALSAATRSEERPRCSRRDMTSGSGGDSVAHALANTDNKMQISNTARKRRGDAGEQRRDTGEGEAREARMVGVLLRQWRGKDQNNQVI